MDLLHQLPVSGTSNANRNTPLITSHIEYPPDQSDWQLLPLLGTDVGHRFRLSDAVGPSLGLDGLSSLRV